MTGARISALALAASLAAAPARADTSDREQIIISDAVSDALIASVFAPGVVNHLHGIPVFIGLAGGFLGGPIIHASHDDWGRAGISFGTRVATPLVGAVVGNALCSDEAHQEFLGCLGDAVIGAAAGLLVAQAIDATLIARGSTAGQMPAVRMLSFGVRF